MPRFINCIQGSPEWHAARAGHVTASRFGDLIEGKGARDSYLWEIVAERLAGGAGRDSGGMAKDWGHEAEDLARQQYMARTGRIVRQVGFAQHSRIKWCGASSDGLVVGEKRGIEIKCPFKSAVHAHTLKNGMPHVHYWQTQGNIWVLELDVLDFNSFDPAFRAPHDLYIESVLPNKTSIKHLEAEVKKFLAEVQVAVNDIQSSK